MFPCNTRARRGDSTASLPQTKNPAVRAVVRDGEMPRDAAARRLAVSSGPCYASARDGNPSAVNDVVDALRPRMARLAFHYARVSGEDPDDLLQEAWLGLLEALPALDLDIGQPEQYLLQRARWRMLDAIKRARVRRCLPLEDTMADAMPSSDAPMSATASVSAFQGTLKDTQRAILRCLMAGLTWREAGTVLGCTSANVAYHVRQIRRQYEEWAGEPVPTR